MKELKKIELWATLEYWGELIIEAGMKAILAALISIVGIQVAQLMGLLPAVHWLPLLFAGLVIWAGFWVILSILLAIQRRQEYALEQAQWHGQWVVVSDRWDEPVAWPLGRAIDWFQDVADEMADPECYEAGEQVNITFTLMAQGTREDMMALASRTSKGVAAVNEDGHVETGGIDPDVIDRFCKAWEARKGGIA